MRFGFLRALGVAAVLATGSTAQSLNEFAIYPDETNVITRGGLAGASGGDVMIAIDSAHFQYIGNECQGSLAVARIRGFRGQLQDENRGTRETYNWTIIPEDPNNPGQPDPTPGVEIWRTPTLMTSPGPAGQIQPFIVSLSLATPLETPDLVNETWYFGVGLPADPAWPFSDGLSVYTASYGHLTGLPNSHDNPRGAVTNINWSIDRGQLKAVPSSFGSTMNLRLLLDTPTLSPGQDVVSGARTSLSNRNPMFGVGGLFPDTTGAGGQASYAQRNGDNDGTVFRVTDNWNQNGMAFMFFALDWAPFPLKIAGFNGSMPVSLLSVRAMPGAFSSFARTGNQWHAIIQPGYLAQGAIPPFVRGHVYFFAITTDDVGGNIRFTNGAAIEYG